jgi:hypothetical protein
MPSLSSGRGVGGKGVELASSILAIGAPVAVKCVHVEEESGGGRAVGEDVVHEALCVGPRGAGANSAGESVLVGGCNPRGNADVADLLRGRGVPRARKTGAGAHCVLHAVYGTCFAGRLRRAGRGDCRGGGGFAA